MQFFSCSWSDVCWFLFLLIFPAFINQTRTLHQVFLLIVGVKISRIFFESDEYLFYIFIWYHRSSKNDQLCLNPYVEYT